MMMMLLQLHTVFAVDAVVVIDVAAGVPVTMGTQLVRIDCVVDVVVVVVAAANAFIS
jgi:hypothetical protein